MNRTLKNHKMRSVKVPFGHQLRTASKCCATVRLSPNCGAGAENTVSDSEVHSATLSAVFLRPKFMVLDVGVLSIRKDGSMAESMFSPPSRPFCVPEKHIGWFYKSHSGAETMTTVNTTTTPQAAPLGNTPATTSNTKLGRLMHTRIIQRRYPALTAPTPSIARQQAIENALSMALYHVRHGDTLQAIRTATAKAIRAASLLKQTCTDSTNAGRA